MENIVCTLPAKPKSTTTDIRLKISPTLVDYIGNGLNYKKGLAINLLNTYNDKTPYFSSYVSVLNKEGFSSDFIFTDKNYINDIMDIIYKMVDEKIIIESTADLLRCECGKVDILKCAVHENVNGSLYDFKNGKVICKFCNKECEETKENILKIDIDKSKMQSISIVPLYFNNVINGIINEMHGSYILISKKRNTGCSINYCGKDYNIDIDFIWTILVEIIPADQKILIAGNRQILKMFIINYINSITSKQKLTFIAHPYIYFDENSRNKIIENEDDIILQKLEILFNLKWKNNNCTFTNSIQKCIKKLSIESKYELYNQMLNYFKKNDKNLPFEVYLEKVLIDSSNLQKNLKILRK